MTRVLIAIVFCVVIGLIVLMIIRSNNRAALSRYERKELESSRELIENIRQRSIQDAQVEPYAQTVLDEINTFHSKNRRLG